MKRPRKIKKWLKKNPGKIKTWDNRYHMYLRAEKGLNAVWLSMDAWEESYYNCIAKHKPIESYRFEILNFGNNEVTKKEEEAAEEE